MTTATHLTCFNLENMKSKQTKYAISGVILLYWLRENLLIKKL